MRLRFLPFLISTVLADMTAFNQVIAKIEKHVLELRDFMELVYLEQRCSAETFLQCQAANYHECDSALPNPTCPAAPDFLLSACSGGNGCGWESQTHSNYRLAPGADISNQRVLEELCYSRLMDEWLINRMAEDKGFWDIYGISPRASYYGTTEGAFRIFPGRSSETCGDYDNRERPWYVAGTSGPKNIVLVLDKSSSMKGERMTMMKEAAIKVIETLTTSDRVAIVTFDDATEVTAFQGQFLYEATKENKEFLIQSINNTEVGSGTNMFEGLKKALDILNNSHLQNAAVNCNSGIIFLTDGVMTKPDGIEKDVVTEMVNSRLNSISTTIGHPVLLFTYSVSEQENVHAYPKELACSTEYGFWSKIETNQKLVEALANYYRFFALGLGTDLNSEFVAWVEPYLFKTGNQLGTTGSAPVYDRTKSPPVLVGVVAVDILLAALRIALGSEHVNEAIKLLATRSVATCPAFELTKCQLDMDRYTTGGSAAMCSASKCFDSTAETISKPCGDSSMYLTQINANNDLVGSSFEDRVCCECGTTEPISLLTNVPTTAPTMISAPPSVVPAPPTSSPVVPATEAPTSLPVVAVTAETTLTPVVTPPSLPAAAPTEKDDLGLGEIFGIVIGSLFSLYLAVVAGLAGFVCTLKCLHVDECCGIKIEEVKIGNFFCFVCYCCPNNDKQGGQGNGSVELTAVPSISAPSSTNSSQV